MMIPPLASFFTPTMGMGMGPRCPVAVRCPFSISGSMIIIRIITFLIIGAMFFYRFYNLFLRDFMARIYNEYFSWLINNIEAGAEDLKFGLWSEREKENKNEAADNDAIKKANEKLMRFICMHAGLPEYSEEKQTLKILDVGCGKGATTLLLQEELERRNIDCEILAVDSKQINIEHALNNHFHKNIEFLHLNPESLCSNALGKFDLILSLDNAHRFSNRPMFFRKVSSLLEPNGVFITTDFVFEADKYKRLFNCAKTHSAFNLCDNILANMLRKSCELTFKIPECNMVNQDVWEKQLDQLFITKKTQNVSNETFVPYYNYIIGKKTKALYGKHTQGFAVNILELICDYQPFECVLGVFQAPPEEKKEETGSSPAAE